MASRNGKRGGERILESRHLIGLFLGVVLLNAVFFTLGYVMGRSQDGGAVHAAASPVPRSASPVAPEARPSDVRKPAPNTPAPGEWDFYADKDKNGGGHNPAAPALTPAPPPSPVKPVPVASAPAIVSAPSKPGSSKASSLKNTIRMGNPKIPPGAIVLQVAAVSRASDAYAMSEVLQQKKFPSFILAPAADNYYRVQVGPYTTERAAEVAKTALDKAGFKPLLKR